MSLEDMIMWEDVMLLSNRKRGCTDVRMFVEMCKCVGVCKEKYGA